jgi:hypothetical protein
MSKVSKKSLIATAMIGALALAGSNIAAANVLTDLQKAEAKIFKQSAKSTLYTSKHKIFLLNIVIL